jgi:uncharacterized membrane protein
MKQMFKKILRGAILLLGIPGLLWVGSVVFQNKKYAFFSVAAALLAMLPFFLRFEKRETRGTLLVLIAVMVALTSVGRLIFAAIPGFKPVTALVVLTAIYFGAEAGFLTGVLSAVISNFYFGQGPWTPFQMFAWGFVGFLAGVFSKALRQGKFKTLWISLFGAFAGALYSLLLDVWSALWMDNAFRLSRYLMLVAAALPWTALYAASNVIFLLVFTKPVGTIMERMKKKYGL